MHVLWFSRYKRDIATATILTVVVWSAHLHIRTSDHSASSDSPELSDVLDVPDVPDVLVVLAKQWDYRWPGAPLSNSWRRRTQIPGRLAPEDAK